jgi:hypothetical protein
MVRDASDKRATHRQSRAHRRSKLRSRQRHVSGVTRFASSAILPCKRGPVSCSIHPSITDAEETLVGTKDMAAMLRRMDFAVQSNGATESSINDEQPSSLMARTVVRRCARIDKGDRRLRLDDCSDADGAQRGDDVGARIPAALSNASAHPRASQGQSNEPQAGERRKACRVLDSPDISILPWRLNSV